VNPVESAVGAGETMTVRISLAMPRELAPGGYWCALTLDEVPDPLSANAGVGVRFVASVSTGIFVYVDPVERDATILGIRVESDRAVVRVRNGGNTPLGVEGRVQFFVPGAAEPLAVMNLPRGTLSPNRPWKASSAPPLPARRPAVGPLPGARFDIGAAHGIGGESSCHRAPAAEWSRSLSNRAGVAGCTARRRPQRPPKPVARLRSPDERTRCQR
jgi:hypothetical protein